MTPIPVTRPPTLPEVAASNGATLRILVVDDNLDAAQSLAMLLKMSRHQVRTAHDGPAALEAALAFQPDVVLLDIGLPKMDGYEVAAKMRQNAVHKDVVLVAMTGYGHDSDRERSQAAGFDHHLVKPAEFSKLQEILATIAERAILLRASLRPTAAATH